MEESDKAKNVEEEEEEEEEDEEEGEAKNVKLWNDRVERVHWSRFWNVDLLLQAHTLTKPIIRKYCTSIPPESVRLFDAEDLKELENGDTSVNFNQCWRSFIT